MKGSIKFPKTATASSITALGCIVGGLEYQGLGRTNVGGELLYRSPDLERWAQHSTECLKKCDEIYLKMSVEMPP